jgi:glutathione S-transferase
MGSCEELRHRLSATSRIADPAQRKAARQALAADYIPLWARGIERLIGHGPFVGGAQPAVADIKIHMIEKALSGGIYDDIPSTILEPYARLKAVARGIANHPAVQAWYASKP